MGKEIVEYHNDMNKISFAGFKEKELDLFFSICQKMKNKGTNEIVFSFSDLRKLSQYSNRSLERFYSDLDRVYKKMLELNLKYEDEKELRRFVLFSRYIIKKEEQIIIIKASEDFEYILNNFIGKFTKFDLIDFISLKSIYSKNMFKLLKQWASVGNQKIKVEELRTYLGVPSKYSTSNFNDRVLKPIMDELPKYFANLKLEKIKTGRKVTDLKFTWSRKKEEIKEAEIVKVAISTRLNKALEKAKKNRFITPLLIEDNIEKLVKQFNEDDLIKGLDWSYKKIKKEIKELSYLTKAIKTGAEKKEIEIVVADGVPAEEITDNGTIEKISSDVAYKKELEYFDSLPVGERANLEEKVYKAYIKECGQETKIQKIAFKGSRNSLIGKYIVENQILKNSNEEIVFKSKEELDNLILERLKDLLNGNNIELLSLDTKFEVGQTKNITTVPKEVGERENLLENVPVEIIPTKETYTEKDIDESLLVGKNGRKLVGAARKNKIEKILLELNKEILITGEFHD